MKRLFLPLVAIAALVSVADFMTREVTEENDWSFPQAVGKGTTRGTTKMRLKPPFRGIVTCVFDWQTNSCLMVEARNPDGPAVYVGGMMGGHPFARLVGAERLRPGDEIEVDGFMEKMLLDPGIVAREIRVIGHRTFDPPRLVSAREILAHELNNCRVAVEGDFDSFYDEETYAGRLTVIRLLTKDGPLTLNLKGAHPDLAALEGRYVRAEGVVLPVPNAHSEYVCSELELLSREGVFLCAEPWRHCLARISKAVLLYSSLPLTFVILAFLLAGWRRRVLAAALAQDRRETAEALHDAVSQQLAGARLMVFSVKSREDIPPSVRANLDSAIGALESARRDVRDAILRLKSDESLQKPLETLIRDMASAINARGEVHLKTRLSAFPDSVTGENKANVLAIIQEAVTNAVRHGQAKKVVVIAERCEGRFVLSVLNDGTPFDAAKALGPEAGHFGLSNMRGRAERSGLALSFGTRKGWMEVRLEEKR